MSDLVHRIVENFQQLFQWIKLKLSKKQTIPQYILFQDFFQCEKTANFVGYSFLNGYESSLNKWTKLNSLVFQFSIFFLFLMEVISFVVSIDQKLLLEAIDNLFCSGIIFVILLKKFFIFYHKKAKICEIIETLDKHFPHSRVDQIKFNVLKYLRVLKLNENGYYFLLAIVFSIFCSMPFVHQIYGHFKSVDVKWKLIMPLKLQFEQSTFIFSGPINLIEIYICIFGIFAITSTDLIFASLLQILSMELDILGQVISEINIADDKEAIKELKNLIDIHQELIEVSEKIEEIFSPLQLFNAFASIIVLCTACFLTAVNNLFYFLKINKMLMFS